jgi:bacteriorhodopsin
MDTFYQKSYQVTFLNLVCISILLYTRSLNTDIKDPNKVLSLQLAGLVTSIASFHYFWMMQSPETPVILRYFDWFFTTPILLIDLCLMYGINNTALFYKIAILNTTMLLLGFLGEAGVLSMTSSTILGFLPFIYMFYLIRQEITPDKSKALFNIFIILWTMYGVNHLNPDFIYKNTSYNILDFLTKGVFGLYVYSASFN